MHDGCYKIWEEWSRQYPRYFRYARVLEVGSMVLPSTPRILLDGIRQLFQRCDHIGVDWREGDGVDVVSLAHEMAFDAPFDLVASNSMLEHDPYWPLSLQRMMELVAPCGAMFLTWGGALCKAHDQDTAPDGAFHALPAQRVIEAVQTFGLHIEQCFYEEHAPQTVALAAFRIGGGYGRIDVLRPEDMA